MPANVVARQARQTYLEFMARASTRPNDAGAGSSDDALDEVLEESFPASDPPSWTLGNGSAAARQRADEAQSDSAGQDSEGGSEGDDERDGQPAGGLSADEPRHPLRVNVAQPPTSGR
jgi:hypothetical protein